jgi:aspartate 1-decarboxylase
VPFEKVQVVNINNGERFETYAIPVEDKWDSPNFGSFIGVNGAGARLVQPGDLLIIMSYQTVTSKFLDDENYEPIVLTCNTKSDGFIAVSDKHTCINCPLGSAPGGVSNYRRSE